VKLLNIIIIFLFFASLITAQESESNKPDFQFQIDSRQTFVSRKSATIFGIRGGVLIDNKYGLGLGIYSSNLFGILGRTVQKDYIDNSLEPPQTFSSEVGFHYFSFYGEYTILENTRWKFTANSQIGTGRVDISFNEPAEPKQSIRTGKNLIEHSIKADVKTFEWLRLKAGIGYRYLTGGETQVKQAFNAPIYIISFSIDFKKLFAKNKEE